jgi:hypothetical protein
MAQGWTNSVTGEGNLIGQGTLSHTIVFGTKLVNLQYKEDLLKSNNLYIATLKNGESNILQFLLWNSENENVKTVVKTTESDRSYYNASLGFASTISFQFYDNPDHFTFVDGAIYDIYEAK